MLHHLTLKGQGHNRSAEKICSSCQLRRRIAVGLDVLLASCISATVTHWGYLERREMS